MKKRLMSMLLVCAMLVFMLPAETANAKYSKEKWDIEKYGDTIDIGPKLRALDGDEEAREKLDDDIKKSVKDIEHEDMTGNSSDTRKSASQKVGVTTKVFPAYNNDSVYLKLFTLMSIGQKCEVWVANNLAFPNGDSRPVPVVTQEQIDRVRDTFDDTIYEKNTGFFGTPDSRDGDDAELPDIIGYPEDYYVSEDGTDRIMILVDNIRDENYYDSSYPFFIAGLYWGTIDDYIDRNAITIDTNSWETRLDNTVLPTLAHEFQHLIHADNDSGEETWINEGMSDFAEYLCGFGHPAGHISFFLDHPENSLVAWDEYYSWPTGPETLADYGQAYLFQLYLNDHFGEEFIRALSKDEEHGIESVNKILEQFDTGLDFNELFRRFAAALVVDSKNPGNGIYNFDSIDIKINYEGASEYDKPGVPAWGADYILLDNAKDIKDIKFDGIDFLTSPWKVADDPRNTGNRVLWGNSGDELSNMILLSADLSDVESATLKFKNLYDIEETWDFGVVQVSDDGGETWESLSNEHTRSDIVDEGYPDIRENLPGFTGYSGDWVDESFDLTPYAGEEILISFRYMTDWGANGNGNDITGWYIDDIEIPEIEYTNNCDDMDSLLSYQKALGIETDYMITFVNEKYAGKKDSPQHYQVKTINPVTITGDDGVEIQKFLSSGNNYIIVWYAAPSGTRDSVDYNYELILKNKHNKKKQ